MVEPSFVITETEFINRWISVWGEDYIADLFEKGYNAVLTTEGWKWILPVTVTKVLESETVAAAVTL